MSRLKDESENGEPERSMQPGVEGRILCLSNIFDDQYVRYRGESVALPLSSAKRRDLFRCLELATGREVIVLSSPPKATQRRSALWLPSARTSFASHRQFVSGNVDAPKLRIPSSWFFYASHVLRHARTNDLVVIDNYEFLYVVAAYATRLTRSLKFILDYEDGKHVTTRGWDGLLSGAAEFLGKPLLNGALLAHPSLAKRLPATLPKLLIPGFFHAPREHQSHPVGFPIRFVYSGSLDSTRGIDLLLESLAFLPSSGWELHISGEGPLENKVVEISRDPAWTGKIKFHRVLPPQQFDALLASCHVALNCQLLSDPISDVTFPSKTFTYLSAGLRVVSSTASGASAALGETCLYYSGDSPADLGRVMANLICDGLPPPRIEALKDLARRYSPEGTTLRLREFFQQIHL